MVGVNVKTKNMSWGIEFNTDIYINKLHFSTLQQLDDLINDLETNNNIYKGEILMFAAATPRDITPEGEEPIFFIKNRIDVLLEEIENNCKLLVDLYHYKEFILKSNLVKNNLIQSKEE